MSSIDNLTEASKKALTLHHKNQSINNTRATAGQQNSMSLLSNQTMTRSDSKTNPNLNNVSVNPLLGTNGSQSTLNVQILPNNSSGSGQAALSGKQDKKRKKQMSQLFYVNNASGGGNPVQAGPRDSKGHNNSISYGPPQQQQLMLQQQQRLHNMSVGGIAQSNQIG